MNGSIRQRKGRPRPWQARYNGPDGKPKSKSFYKKKEAERWLRAEISKMDRGTWIDPAAGKQPYGEYATEWLDSLVDVKPKTLHGYTNLLHSRVLPQFGAYELRRINPQSIRTWIAAMVGEGLSPSRIRQAHQILRASLKQATSDGLIGRNPAVGIQIPRDRHRDMLHLTADQIGELADLCEEQQEGAGLLVRFLAWSGIRWSEATALRRSSLDRINHSVIISEAATEVGGRLVWGTPKSHRSRTLVLARSVFGLVDNRSSDLAGNDLVFTSPEGGPLHPGNFRSRVWRPAVTKLAERYPELAALRIHDLRHTAASLAISCDGNVLAVQRMLGHKDASVTLNRYSHLYNDDLITLARAMDEKYLAA